MSMKDSRKNFNQAFTYTVYHIEKFMKIEVKIIA